MYLLLVAAIVIIKILLCKGFTAGILLFLFWIAGKMFHFNSDKWDNFFILLPAKKVQKYFSWIYITAAIISSAISYGILELANYPHSFAIAIVLFISGIVISSYKWHRKKEDFLKKYQEIPQKILKERENY